MYVCLLGFSGIILKLWGGSILFFEFDVQGLFWS